MKYPENEKKLAICKALYDRHISLDIYYHICEYLFKSNDDYNKEFSRRHKTICFYIDVADSRKNGFNGHEETDTDDPHWIFFIPKFTNDVIYTDHDFGYDYEVSLQGISCPFCGEYEHANSHIPNNILCKCIKMY